LRTPITALDGFLEGLEDGVFEPDSDILAAMRSETRRMQRLTTDLGALSRAAEATFDLQRQTTDLAAVATAAARGLAAAARSAEVDLVITEGPELPASIDIDRMGQVFTNLITNAIRHTPAGGTVTLGPRRIGDTALIDVSDTGTGIAPEHLDRVFDRFYRVDRDSPPSGGAGIGLTIARGIARAHGGDVTIMSEGMGRGSTFTVAIPTAP
jgi:histidine kinase